MALDSVKGRFAKASKSGGGGVGGAGGRGVRTNPLCRSMMED